MSDLFVKFNGRIDRRSPFNEGSPEDPILRENWLSRNGRLSMPPGHEAVITGLTAIPRWMGRYHTIETGAIPQKTFVYTEDGKIWVLDDAAGTATVVKELLNLDAYPKHWLFKTANQTKMFLVDGRNLFKYDGNNNNTFETVTLEDANGDSVEPIDVIEHKDRLFVISNTSLFVSKNLDPETFDDATDSIEIIVGSGKGTNLAFGKIEDKLYIFNTEGIFVLEGDVISALASTFEVRLVEERKIIAGRTAVKVEKAILFLADDYELWSWDGNTSQLLSFELILRDFVSDVKQLLEKATAIYHDNYYKMTFVEKGDVGPKIEIWWDAFENKLDIVRDRNVTCYMKTDPTIEQEYMQMGIADFTIVQEGRGKDFGDNAIRTRLRTRDITPKKGRNLRFTAFYPEFEPAGDKNMTIRYLLDGRGSNPDGSNAHWTQNLRGETKTVSNLEFGVQTQFTGRVRPKINYAKGESVAFEIINEVSNLDLTFLGMGMDFVVKDKSKGATIGA